MSAKTRDRKPAITDSSCVESRSFFGTIPIRSSAASFLPTPFTLNPISKEMSNKSQQQVGMWC